MPKYYYHCNNCDMDFFKYHMIAEVQKDCTLCGLEGVNKLLTKPLYFDNKNIKQDTGDITKKYIDDNKKILEDMKKEVESEIYD